MLLSCIFAVPAGAVDSAKKGAAPAKNLTASPRPKSTPNVTPNSEADKALIDAINSPVLDKWALVVGVSKFADSSLNLKYAAKDARDFYNYLVTEGNFKADHVQLLLDEEATRESILDMFGDKWLPHAALPGDLVVIYISSHGSPAGLDVGEVNYIIAHNTDKERLFSTGVSLQELIQLIKKRVHSDRVIAILDTCFSGAAGADSKGVLRTTNVDADEIAQGTGQMVICSSEPNQTSWESKNYQNSVFTHQLLEGLRLKGNNTTLEEAFQYMKSKVQEEVVKDRGALQTPVLKSRWQGGKLVLAVNASNPRTPPILPKPIKKAPEKPAVAVVVAAPVTVSTPAPPPVTPPPPPEKVIQTQARPSASHGLPPIKSTESAMSWETWSARMQAAKTMLEEDDDKESRKALAMLKAERDKLGTNDPRIYIAERKNQILAHEREEQNSMPASCRAFLEAGTKSFKKGEYIQAEAAFKSAIKEIENRNANEKAMATCLDGIALCLMQEGKVVPATALLKQATTIDEAGAASSGDLALRLEHYSSALFVQRKHAEAKAVAKRALNLWETELGANHPQVSRAMNLLAAIMTAQKEYAEAELLIKRSIEIDDAAPWFRFPDKSQGLFNLALLKKAEGKNTEARTFFKQALAARERLDGSSNIMLAGILASTAANDLALGRKPDAESNLRRALSIEQKKFKPENTYLKYTAAKLIALYKDSNKLPKAEELSALYPDLANAEKAEEMQYLYELPAFQLSSPFKIPEVWNIHVTESSGELYGRWTWDSGKKQFTAAWDTGDYGVVKLSRYDREQPVLHYSQAKPEASSRYNVKVIGEFGMSGACPSHDLLGKDGKWEAFW